jgi:hypothetical protein
MSKFKVFYDDQPDNGVDRLASLIEKFGIKVERLEGGDGFEEFEVTATDYKEQSERLLKERDAWEKSYNDLLEHYTK